MPILYILAGPNGTGKTTYYETIIEQNFIDKSLPFLNIDVITKNELGSYNQENFAQAEQIYRTRIKEYILASKDFMIESNLARIADYDWILNMIKQGYHIILYFLCTDNLSINIQRVQKRVKEGGHDIPVNIIENRYKLSILYLRSRMHLFTKCYLIDNTIDNPLVMAIISEGKIEMKLAESNEWVNNVLYILERKKY